MSSSIESRMQGFLERLFASDVARPEEVDGCSPEEIEALERRYQIKLPLAYTLFLSHLGHGAGLLGNRGEFDLSYEDAMRLTEEERASWQSIRTTYPDAPPVAFPSNGLIFCVRLGLPNYWFLVCNGGEDSPVIHFDYEQDEGDPVRLKWLRSPCSISSKASEPTRSIGYAKGICAETALSSPLVGDNRDLHLIRFRSEGRSTVPVEGGKPLPGVTRREHPSPQPPDAVGVEVSVGADEWDALDQCL